MVASDRLWFLDTFLQVLNNSGINFGLENEPLWCYPLTKTVNSRLNERQMNDHPDTGFWTLYVLTQVNTPVHMSTDAYTTQIYTQYIINLLREIFTNLSKKMWLLANEYIDM